MPVKKGILDTTIHSASPNYTENSVISMLKDMVELKDFTGLVTCMYDYFLWL
jgi:hypothetical protein